MKEKILKRGESVELEDMPAGSKPGYHKIHERPEQDQDEEAEVKGGMWKLLSYARAQWMVIGFGLLALLGGLGVEFAVPKGI